MHLGDDAADLLLSPVIGQLSEGEPHEGAHHHGAPLSFGARLASIDYNIFRPTHRFYRLVILAFASSLLLGSYFAYDSISSTSTQLQLQMGIGDVGAGYLYAIYSLPNIVMVFAGGILVDRVGTRRASLLFSSLVTLGAVIVAMGPAAFANDPEQYCVQVEVKPPAEQRYFTNDKSAAADAPQTELVCTGGGAAFWLMLVGRFVFGLGAESLVVTQNAILTRWFTGRELAMSFGIALTVSRVGTLLSFNVLPSVSASSITLAYWLAASACLLALFFCVVLVFLDYRASKVLTMLSEEEKQGDFDMKRIGKFPVAYWLVVGLCVAFYSCVLPFTSFGVSFFTEKWDLDPEVSGRIVSIISFSSMIFSPISGFVIDKIGRRTIIMIAGTTAVIPAYLLLALTPVYPAVAVFVIGAAFSLVPSALWPCIPLLIHTDLLGTAFGLLTAIQNCGLFLVPMMIGWFRDTTGSFMLGNLFFATLSAVGLVLAIVLHRLPASRILMLPSGPAAEMYERTMGGEQPYMNVELQDLHQSMQDADDSETVLKGGLTDRPEEEGGFSSDASE